MGRKVIVINSDPMDILLSIGLKNYLKDANKTVCISFEINATRKN